MASWDDLVSYVRMRYEIMRQTDGELWFNLPTTGERTQLVVMAKVTGDDGHEWAQVASPIGRVADIDLVELLTLTSNWPVGGIAARDGVAIYRHSVALADAVFATFEREFRMVVEIADKLEEELTDSDEN